MTDLHHYEEMFDYLREVPAPEESAGLLVFGRKEPLVAYAAGGLIVAGLAEFAVISGGVGKDSGDLTVPEAVYLKDELSTYLADRDESETIPILTETKATNGGENVRFSLDLMDATGIPDLPSLNYHPSLITVAWAVSARRLHELTKHEADQRGTPIENLRGVATDTTFGEHADDPKFLAEIVAEYQRFDKWPGKGWLRPDAGADLDPNLVEFANDMAAANK
jgi:hypothetical protein